LLIVILTILGVSACGSSQHSSSYSAKKFSPSFPSFLPKATLHPHDDAILTGTTAKPALTIEGDSVEVKTPAWSVLVDVSGPTVPGEGLPYQTQYTTCTWTITMSKATGSVPISLADFNSLDHFGQVYRLKFVAGQPEPPAVLEAGHTVTFEVRSYELVGEGLMRWAPIDKEIVAMWDYEVEND
jgi:hypothetical protein